jgi:hypothetical protein
MTARTRWSLLIGLTALLAAGRASAQTTPCTVDTDCPGTACGTQVCAHDSGGIRCVDQGALGSSGSEGWCADSSGAAKNSNCKCAALGATCEGFLCSFTVPPATGTGGSTGAGGSTGTAGTTGAGGSGTGGATGSAGSGGGGGGCSVAGAPSFGGSLGVALLAAALLRRRGRRRV